MAPRQSRLSSQPGFFGHPESVRRIGPFLISQNRYAPGARLHHHAHRNAFISFVIEGDYTEYCGSRTSLFLPGTLGYHPANEEHSDHFGRRDALVLGIEVGGEEHEGTKGWGSRFLSDGPETRIAWHIAREFQHRCPTSDLIVECLATELGSDSSVRGGRRGTPRWLAKAVEIAHDGFSERLGLAEVASSAGVHPVHLARQFRSRLGCTYGEFVRRVRLTRALERLRNGSQPIAEVAADTGFADQSHLTRLMTAVVGISPAAYRRRFQPNVADVGTHVHDRSSTVMRAPEMKPEDR